MPRGATSAPVRVATECSAWPSPDSRLAARAIQYSSRQGENVLDPFGGSGSTLIEAEQTGWRAFLMEVDPLYCDVIVQRWEEYTGQKRELVSVTEVTA